MTFQPGNDLGGRTAGSRNKTSYALRERLRSRPNHIDPADFLADLISNPAESADVRIAASGQLMPYYHSKLGATPVQPDPVYLELAISIPRPTSIRQACDNITLLSEMKATGKLDVVSADSLINDQRVVLNAMVDEAKLLTAQGGSPEQTIRIEGGLPPLPGTDVIMPDRDLNGHQLELTAVVNPQAAAQDPVASPQEKSEP